MLKAQRGDSHAQRDHLRDQFGKQNQSFCTTGFVITANMYFVYILYSHKDGKLYLGYTSDIRERITTHQKGLVTTTKNRLPIQLIGYEAFLSQSDAKRREKYLKGSHGRQQLKIQYQDIFKKLGYRFR